MNMSAWCGSFPPFEVLMILTHDKGGVIIQQLWLYNEKKTGVLRLRSAAINRLEETKSLLVSERERPLPRGAAAAVVKCLVLVLFRGV